MPDDNQNKNKNKKRGVGGNIADKGFNPNYHKCVSSLSFLFLAIMKIQCYPDDEGFYSGFFVPGKRLNLEFWMFLLQASEWKGIF